MEYKLVATSCSFVVNPLLDCVKLHPVPCEKIIEYKFAVNFQKVVLTSGSSSDYSCYLIKLMIGGHVNYLPPDYPHRKC